MKKPYKNNKSSEIKKWNSPHEAQKPNPSQNGGKSGSKTLKKSVDRERNERKAPHHTLARSRALFPLSFSLSLSRYGAPSFFLAPAVNRVTRETPGFTTMSPATFLLPSLLFLHFSLHWNFNFYNATHKRKLFLNPLAHSDIYLYLCVYVQEFAKMRKH